MAIGGSLMAVISGYWWLAGACVGGGMVMCLCGCVSKAC